MGLDIYFNKVKPSKGVNVNSVEELSADRTAQHKKKFNRVVKAIVKQLKTADEETRTSVVQKLQDVMREYMVYDWYYKKITPEKSNEELLEIVKKNKKMFYAHEDVYFRKANFVYRFFHPYLDNEKCIVTTDMVKELLAKTDKVIAAAQADGVITPNGILDKKYFVCEDYYELTDEAAKKEYDRAEKEQKEMPRNWVKVAEEELPTTSGFFFGSTEYDVFYLQDILSCKEQFTELLENWKPNEIVYNIMSW